MSKDAESNNMYTTIFGLLLLCCIIAGLIYYYFAIYKKSSTNKSVIDNELIQQPLINQSMTPIVTTPLTVQNGTYISSDNSSYLYINGNTGSVIGKIFMSQTKKVSDVVNNLTPTWCTMNNNYYGILITYNDDYYSTQQIFCVINNVLTMPDGTTFKLISSNDTVPTTIVNYPTTRNLILNQPIVGTYVTSDNLNYIFIRANNGCQIKGSVFNLLNKQSSTVFYLPLKTTYNSFYILTSPDATGNGSRQLIFDVDANILKLKLPESATPLIFDYIASTNTIPI